ncbi:MAG: hypothetical protein AAGF15_04775 [Pseudomonadota bacterium]
MRKAALLRLRACLSLISMMFALMAIAPQAFAAGDKTAEAETVRFLKFETMVLSVFEERQVKGLMQVRLALKILHEENAAEIEAARLRLRDIYIRTLSSYGGTLIRIGHTANMAILQRRLQRLTDRMLGPGETELFIIEFATRPA